MTDESCLYLSSDATILVIFRAKLVTIATAKPVKNTLEVSFKCFYLENMVGSFVIIEFVISIKSCDF